MGLKYNDTTGEFFEEENEPRQMRRQSVRRDLPHKQAKLHAPKKVRRVPAQTPHKLAKLAIFAKLAKWSFYPFIKWWEVEKDTIDDGEWFFAVFWIFPLFVLVGFYNIAVSFIMAIFSS